jgi:hypothetical protein
LKIEDKTMDKKVAKKKVAKKKVAKKKVVRKQIEGKYSNVAFIKHSQREFVFDFMFESEGHGRLVSRIISSPSHAKAILKVLGENIKKHEDTFGKIKDY